MSAECWSEIARKMTSEALRTILEIALYELKIGSPFFIRYDSCSGASVKVGSVKRITYTLYDYLDLRRNSRCARAAISSIISEGTSTAVSRLIGGQRCTHRCLEERIATYYRSEDAICFVSGHATNVTVLSSMLSSVDAIFLDEYCHNSIYEGATHSRADVYTFRHNSCSELENLLLEFRSKYKRVLITVEGLYSMDGDFPDLSWLVELKAKFDVMLFVDEAHSIGTLGPTGGGISEAIGIDPRDIDIWMGSLSKALASTGGFVCGSHELISFLRFNAPGFVYSVGLPPPLAATTSTALDVIREEPERVLRLQDLSAQFHRRAISQGLDICSMIGSPIIPIFPGNSVRVMALFHRLFEHGIITAPIFAPAVPEKLARLRLFITNAHTEEMNERTVDLLCELQEDLDEWILNRAHGTSVFKFIEKALVADQ